MAHVFIGDLETKRLYNLDHIVTIEGRKEEDGTYTARLYWADDSCVDIKAPKLVDSAAQVAAWIQQFEMQLLHESL